MDPMFDQVTLAKIMTLVDDKTLGSLSQINRETASISNDLLFKIERAIIDLKEVFNIITVVDDGNYHYGDFNKFIYNPSNNPYEFLLYRRSLLTGRAKVIHIPEELCSTSTYDDDEKILEYIIAQEARRGDIIDFTSLEDYEGCEIGFFNGKKIVLPSYEESGCDVIPFPILKEFSPNYWGKETYWMLVNYELSEEKKEEILNSLEYVYKDDTNTIIKRKIDDEVENINKDISFIGYFTSHGIQWKITFVLGGGRYKRKDIYIKKIKHALNNTSFDGCTSNNALEKENVFMTVIY